jgi:PAS domain S-box-containing protein
MVTWAEVERGRGPTGTAIRTGRPIVCYDTLTDPSFAPWRVRAVERGFRSCIALPLMIEGRTMGALSIYAPTPAAFESTEVTLLTELAQDLAFGIQNLRLRAEHDRAEQRLRYLASIVEDSEDAIYSKSLDGTIVSWNRGAEETYGYTAAEAVGRNISFLFPAELGNEMVELLRQVAEGANVKNYETVRLSKDGARREVSLTLSPLHDRQGRVVGVSSIARDISARRRAERELERYTAELARSNAELQDFASIASHDLQEPLRKVLAFGDRLQDHCAGQLDDLGRDFLRRMQNAAARMSTLIEALLQYSRVSSRAQPFQPVDLQQVALEVIADLETSIQEAHAQVSVGVLPRLVADRTQMWQLLQNLLSNAIKFRRPGAAPEVLIDGYAVENGCWEIRVRDNGIGFEEQHLERIFRPFQRLHGRNEYAGSGMGLAICRKIVARHGGTLTATSQTGQGATFVVTLPALADERSTSWSSSENAPASCLPKTMTTITS